MKKIIIGIIIGMLISSVAYASVSLTSDKVSYKDTTVKDSLDNLFDESVNGKIKIAEAITNKGIETLDTDSYDTIVSNINNISTGNPYLRYNEDTGYIQALDEDGNWINLYQSDQLPIAVKREAYEMYFTYDDKYSYFYYRKGVFNMSTLVFTSSVSYSGGKYSQDFNINLGNICSISGDWALGTTTVKALKNTKLKIGSSSDITDKPAGSSFNMIADNRKYYVIGDSVS